MKKEPRPFDVTHMPELLRLAEEVRRTGQSVVLTDGERELAMLTPLVPASTTTRTTRRSSKSANRNDWLLGLIDIGANVTPADHATDVSANKHKYLADAYDAEAHPQREEEGSRPASIDMSDEPTTEGRSHERRERP